MKTTIKMLSALLICLVFTSCDKDLLDVDFNTTVKATIVAHVDKYQETIDESVVLSLDNKDTHDYLNKIENVKIKKLTYKIISFSGDPEGYIDVDFYADTITLTTEEFFVKEAYNAGTVFEITDISKLNTMANILKKNISTTVGIIGQSSAMETDMDFNIEVTAELEVTANPL
ncbi:hypothetical protein [uncultured Formosa sp.]|uniref:hypothetical protein n=1 Tax=uncultured Formosa sp. TaxID=255435 RepID=UPI00260CD07F|nr:hypothetical protein [uncultured Formosa sp.]